MLSRFGRLFREHIKGISWRCLLYQYGGVCSDLKQVFVKKLDEIINHPELVLIKDLHGSDIQISFMASKPGHIVFKNAYETVIKKVEKKDYGFDYLHLTGPRLFGDVFHTIDLLPNSYTMEYEQYGISHIREL